MFAETVGEIVTILVFLALTALVTAFSMAVSERRAKVRRDRARREVQR
jgi:hypothetical protein